jgi:hypothetical protein
MLPRRFCAMPEAWCENSHIFINFQSLCKSPLPPAAAAAAATLGRTPLDE